MGKIVFIGNYKGGVGKTTTVVNFANYLSKEGHKVLTIINLKKNWQKIIIKNDFF